MADKAGKVNFLLQLVIHDHFFQQFDCGIGRQISIFSPDNSLRIKSSGLAWKTDEVVFDNWWKATLNRATQDRVRLEFSHRSIALVMMN